MVSIGPYVEELNFRHMFDIPDLRVKRKQCYPKGTIMGIIERTPQFSKFRQIIKNARMEGPLGDLQVDATLFITSDEYLTEMDESVVQKMDMSTARHIVKSSMLKRNITSDLLKDSPATYFNTEDSPNRLFVSNISGRTYINNDINIVDGDIFASNGVIHVIDKLILPLMV